MNKLREFRESQGLSRRQMALNLGVSHSFYEKIELGDRMMSRKFLEKLKQKYPAIDVNIFFAQ